MSESVLPMFSSRSFIVSGLTLLGIHTEETRRERDTCTPMFIIIIHQASLIVQLVKNPPAMQETPV